MSIRKSRFSKLYYFLSILYGGVVRFRNLLYDKGFIKQNKFPIPILVVGNISVGGTGKTPHVEYIIELLLKEGYKVAVLSRGYKRKTKGLIEADINSTASEIGDEPWQIKHKYPDIRLIVDSNRSRGIQYILDTQEEISKVDIVVMDDGFQHRKVKPSFSIILSDYSNPFNRDYLLPYGELREPAEARFRSEAVIVTKCPKDISPIEYSIIERELNLYPHQSVFFSFIEYNKPKSIESFSNYSYICDDIELKSNCIAVGGMAKNTIFFEYISSHYNLLESLSFPDHHSFNNDDIASIEQVFDRYAKGNKSIYIFTSEKDAVRLFELKDKIRKDIYNCIYYIPIVIDLQSKTDKFKSMIRNIININSK